MRCLLSDGCPSSTGLWAQGVVNWSHLHIFWWCSVKWILGDINIVILVCKTTHSYAEGYYLFGTLSPKIQNCPLHYQRPVRRLLLGQFCARWKKIESVYRTIPYCTVSFFVCLYGHIFTFYKYFFITSLKLRGQEWVLLGPPCGPSNISRGYLVYWNPQHLLYQIWAVLISFLQNVFVFIWGLLVAQSMSWEDGWATERSCACYVQREWD